MTAPNLLTPTSHYGHSDGWVLTGTEQEIVSNAAASGKTILVRSLQITNKSPSTAVEATILFNDVSAGPTAYELASTLSIPANSTVVLIGKDSVGSFYLEEGDSISGYAAASDLLAVTVVYDEVQ